MFDWPLNMPQSVYVVIGVRNVALKSIEVQSKSVLNIFGTF